MKFDICAFLAMALVAAAPVQAAELAPGEIMLHINAQGSVMADQARFEITIIGESDSREAAEASLRLQETAIADKLRSLGVARSSIVTSQPDFNESQHEVWDEAALYAPQTETGADAEAAADAWVPALVSFWSASATVTVTVEDVATLGEAMTIARGEYGLAGGRPQFLFKDEAKAQRDAVARAIANARADAETYADAMDYRVVRIVAVSNDGPPLSMPSILQALATIDNPAREWSLMGQKLATVSIDFAIAPR